MFDDPKHLSFATDRLPWQRSLRWTRPAIDARRVALGILLGIVLTAIELIAFGIGMHRQIANQTPARPPDVVLVQLIDDTAFEFPAIPEPEPPIRAASRAMPHVRPVTVPFVSPPAPSNATSSETPALRLYDPDGHLRLPESIAPGIGAETGFSAPSRAPGDAFARRNPVPYEPTRFESVWTPSGETLGGELFVFADTDVPMSHDGDRGAVLKVASGGNMIAPAVFTVPLQMLAYHVAVLRGTDVDQPRNLAKSVTVE